jgi:hypothetical protein
MTTLLITSCLNSLFLSYPFTVTSIVTPMLVSEGKSRPTDRPSMADGSESPGGVDRVPTGPGGPNSTDDWVHSTSGVPTVGAHTLLIARSSLHQLETMIQRLPRPY